MLLTQLCEAWTLGSQVRRGAVVLSYARRETVLILCTDEAIMCELQSDGHRVYELAYTSLWWSW